MELCEKVFPRAELANLAREPDFFAHRAILAIRNDQLSEFNDQLLDDLPREEHTFYAADQAQTDGIESGREEVTREFLQTVNLPGLPPSILRLKVGAPVIMLRNLRPQKGLCNGTRLVITHLGRRVIRARILTGDHKGSEHLIPRILLSSMDGDLPWVVTRRQYPIRLCFAMTVNKSQGQTLKIVGVDLRSSAFSHGHLNVALSRGTDVNHLTVLLPQDVESTTNVVYPEVLI